ncbi:MAG TPA: hypothetical protein VKS79_13710 [Gemmataceae bacterium]|nr:hypothetical protein [Gemmataceae bacterium]
MALNNSAAPRSPSALGALAGLWLRWLVTTDGFVRFIISLFSEILKYGQRKTPTRVSLDDVPSLPEGEGDSRNANLDRTVDASWRPMYDTPACKAGTSSSTAAAKVSSTVVGIAIRGEKTIAAYALRAVLNERTFSLRCLLRLDEFLPAKD